MTHIRLVALSCLLFLASFAMPTSAEACSCMQPDLVRSVSDNDHVFRGRVRAKIVFGPYRYFKMRIRRTYKGCYEPGGIVYLRSSAQSSMCGQDLSVGDRYLITGSDDTAPNGSPIVSFNICGYNTLFNNTTAAERTYLNNRYVDCPGTYQGCAEGSPQVNCVVDPCQNAPTCGGGPCEESFCGGCNREYYDSSGDAVCESDWTITPP